MDIEVRILNKVASEIFEGHEILTQSK
jgi:hypothetical protein